MINLAESGVKVESVLQRIRELEHANDLLQEHLRSIDKRRPEKSYIKMMAIEIERIVSNFQNEFQNGTLAEQKDQIRRFVSAVEVHRTEQPRAHCYIRKIPLINQSIGLSIQCVAGARTSLYSQHCITY